MYYFPRNWPVARVSRLYHRHAFSQNYFYTRNITDLLDELITPATLHYEDQLMLDTEEYLLKRFYKTTYQPVKMRSIGEYSHYQQPVPAIFHKEVEYLHVRWRQRKQKLLVRQLQQAFNIYQQSTATKKQQRATPDEKVDVSNLLGYISYYNPKSTNYYLRKGRNSRLRGRQPQYCSSLESIQRELNGILSRCSFVDELSMLGDRTARTDKLRPIVNANFNSNEPQREKPIFSYNFRKKQQEEVKLGDKIVLAFHPSFAKKEYPAKKKYISTTNLKIREVRCTSTEKYKHREETRQTSNHKPNPQKRAESESRLRIRLQNSNSKDREKTPSIEFKRTATKDRVNSQQSEQTGYMRNYRSTVLRKETAPKNFLTLNIEPSRPVRSVIGKVNLPLRLRGV